MVTATYESLIFLTQPLDVFRMDAKVEDDVTEDLRARAELGKQHGCKANIL